ncbi:subtilisin-like protease SBT4.4 [Ziziphus jujuba]|uniref:Subtilisin-like protease SBT4.4 n=1 Tax=Ziziphus jujuba TaxID=326968 RepID=A0A6P6FXM3_ZIZJJ|nr:subtilisin-like protease SBT4.4 [Ziziphus jujuba]
MAKYIFYLLISIFMLSRSLRSKANDNDDRKEYIVYMGSLPDDVVYSPTANHISLLQGVLDQGSTVEKSLITSYRRSFNGFAAKLTDTERQRLAEVKGVVSIFPNRNFKVQTTRSWDFIGLHQKTERNPTVESDIIIGVLDTGIWPESDSFNDEGFGSPPKKWKGACIGGDKFKCNNKIIGARYYLSELSTVATARDFIGHGTHTASIAAGNNVKNVSFFGIAQGTARGAVPSARIAVYKVCEVVCSEINVLSGFDDAIADGVDIISVSLGGSVQGAYDADAITIGSFHGLSKGVLTINSAGNDGITAGTVSSPAPWTMTVAASSIDRHIVDKVVLGNGQILLGNSVNSFTLNGTSFPMIYGKDAGHHDCDIENSRNCLSTCINKTAVNGKILLCDLIPPASDALGGVFAAVGPRIGLNEISFVEPVPVAAVNFANYSAAQAYFNSTKNPRATILKSESITDSDAPHIPNFSSRGPNFITPDILKPDVTAPGIDILAAYSPVVSPSVLPTDQRRVKYNILSGTSMSCPHVAGAAAYVKTFHPNWSPSAIKSSLMTTAWVMNTNQSSDGEFGYGAGHIDPVKALDPGLVYETSKDDYIKFLCGIGFGSSRLRLITGDNSTCPKITNFEPKDLNYPTLAHEVVQTNGSFTVEFQRRVKNVGLPNANYKVKVNSNPRLDIEVVPGVLSFKSMNEEKSFNVTVKGEALPIRTMLSSSIVWSDSIHSVRSPVVIFNSLFTD